MGNVLNPLGYTSIAYHGGQYTYYSRNETLPNLATSSAPTPGA